MGDTYRCKRCGAPRPPSNSACKNCGKAAGYYEDFAATQQTQLNRNLIVALFLVFVVLLAGYRGNVAPTASPTEAPTATVGPTTTAILPSATEAPTATLEPTAVPTEVPTPVPTEIPDHRTVVVLTIDDGWNKGVFDAMLDILTRHNSRATFFLVGTASINLGPERLERLIEEGHEIAYHSYNHDQLEVLETWKAGEWLADYDRWVAVMKDLLDSELYNRGVRPYARAPYGLFSAGFIQMTEAKGLTYFGWDTDVHVIHRVPVGGEGAVVLGHVRQSDLADFEALVLSPIYRVVSISEYLEKAPGKTGAFHFDLDVSQ